MRRVFALVASVAVIALCVYAGWRSGDREPFDEIVAAEARTAMNLDSRRIDVGELTLHVVLAGPVDGPPVVLLHGFPEFWFVWHRQIEMLAREGFRVAAPDLRGYARSDKPGDASDYSGEHHVADVIGLIDALGWSDVYLAAHDVGGGIAWRLVFERPERLRRVLVFNTGHPLAWRDAPSRADDESITWFRSFFRLPWLPEWVGRAGGYYLLRRNLIETSRPGTFSASELRIYETAWARDNALSSMLGSYRADSVPIAGIPQDGRTAIPVRVVWGERDAFTPLANALRTAEYLGDENVIRVPEASHWILLEEPILTSRAMIDFFGEDLRERAVAAKVLENASPQR